LAKFPWIGQTPELISGKHCRAIGKARLLLDFFTHHQTDREGRVWYGKTISYDWIRKKIPDCPAQRTLQRYVARLRQERYIETHTVVHRRHVTGFKVTMLNQAKFAAPALPRQMGFFTEPLPISANSQGVQKPVEKMSKPVLGGGDRSVTRVVTEVAAKRSTSDKSYETTKTPAASPRAQPPRWKTAKAKQILREIERWQEVYAGSFEREDLERLRDRIDPLYEQLRRLGCVFSEPAGADSERGPASAVG